MYVALCRVSGSNLRRINMRLFASVLASFVVALLTAAPAQAELVLAVNEGVTYYVTPAEIREKYKDLADLLGKQLKTTVRVVPVDQYPVLRKGLDEQQYDLAFVHPAHHSLVSLRDGKYRLVVLTKGYTEYKARFFVSKDAKMKRPEDPREDRLQGLRERRPAAARRAHQVARLLSCWKQNAKTAAWAAVFISGVFRPNAWPCIAPARSLRRAARRRSGGCA